MYISVISNRFNQAYLPNLNKQKYVQTCKSDKVAFSGNFSKLEKQAMKTVKTYAIENNLETCRIIKNNRDISKCFKMLETKNSCQPYPLIEDYSKPLQVLKLLLEYRRNMKDATFIHSHAVELPLSMQDILAAIKLKSKKMITITPSGKYMSVDFDNKTRKSAKKYITILNKTSEKCRELASVYGSNFLYENEELLKKYQDFSVNNLKEFFEKAGLKVETNFY